jgi:hypothetical protein
MAPDPDPHPQPGTTDSFANGPCCANIAAITMWIGESGTTITVDCVVIYTVDDDGRITSIRAHWEPAGRWPRSPAADPPRRAGPGRNGQATAGPAARDGQLPDAWKLAVIR